MSAEIDIQRAQILRQRCNRIFAGKSVHDVVGAIEMLTADAILALPGQSEASALSSAEAIAADVREIIHERFAISGKAH